mgnify:CR=1 FL=1
MRLQRSISMFLVLFVTAATSLYAGLPGALTHAALTKTNADIPVGTPGAVIDLATENGVSTVKGQWRYSDTKIVETDFRGPGPDKQPTGAPVRTYDYTPHAGAADFDDSKWEVISPTTLDQRRGNGRLGFNWYRMKLTIPDRVGDFDPTG